MRTPSVLLVAIEDTSADHGKHREIVRGLVSGIWEIERLQRSKNRLGASRGKLLLASWPLYGGEGGALARAIWSSGRKWGASC